LKLFFSADDLIFKKVSSATNSSIDAPNPIFIAYIDIKDS